MAIAVGLLATMPPSQYISPDIKTGLKTVGAAVDALKAYRCRTRKLPVGKTTISTFQRGNVNKDLVLTWMSRPIFGHP